MTDLSRKPFYRALDVVEIGDGNAISYRGLDANYPNRQFLMCHAIYDACADVLYERVGAGRKRAAHTREIAGC